MITAVILAAGRGERMGGVAKALLPLGHTHFLGAIAATARDAGVDRLRVVVGAPFGDAVAMAARALGAEVVTNPDPARGMASSVACGFAGLAGDLALLWPVDHPYVAAASVRAVLAAAREADVVVPRVDGAGGHPVAVGPAVWPALAACDNAREVLRNPQWRRRDLNLDDPGLVRDVDAP